MREKRTQSDQGGQERDHDNIQQCVFDDLITISRQISSETTGV